MRDKSAGIQIRAYTAALEFEWLAAPRGVGGGQFEVLGTLLAQTLSSRLNLNEKWHLWPAAGLHWHPVYPWL